MPRRSSTFFSEASATIPLLVAADEALAIVRVPGGEFDLVLLEAEGLQHGEGEIHAAVDFVFNLLRHAEDVGVVLGKAAHPQQAVHHARALVAIDRAQLAQPHRQIAIRLQRVLIDQDVERTVHRLHAIVRIVQFHRGEHVLRVVALVAADFPQIDARHVRRAHQRIAALQVLVVHPVLHLLADDAALGMPEDQSRPGELLDRTGQAACPARDGRASWPPPACAGSRPGPSW